MLRQVKPIIPLRVKDCLLCILSAILLILSFPNFNLWIFAWFGFVPLFFAIKGKSKGKAFLLSYLVGIIFWLGTIYWLVHVTLAGLILLVLYLALYFGIFGWIVKIYELRATSYKLLFVPAIWVLLEYLRSNLLTGFPWALLGYSQYQNLPVIQIADITGAEGVSFLVMMVNAAIYLCLVPRASFPSIVKKCLVPLLGIIVTLTYGYYKIYESRITNHQPRVGVCVIQGNIAQELKWEPKSKDYIFNEYAYLTEQAVAGAPDLIIWPEASSPELLGEDGSVFAKIFSLSKKIKTPLLIGAVVREKEKYFNSALLIDNSGKITSRYDKLHLVPFGEYIPLKNIFPFLETVVPIGDISAGEEYTIFEIPNPKSQIPNKFAVLICFEDLFPQISRQFIKRGADFLVNITNDAWYKKTAAASQHFQASVFRAVENRVSLVRSANTGVSGFIAPTGRVISLVKDKTGRDIFISGYGTEEIGTKESKDKNKVSLATFSFYSRYGDIFLAVCFIFVLFGIIFSLKNKR